MRQVPGDLIQFIQSGAKFIVAGHKEPDGDCVGSQLALCSALRRLGKEAIPCSAGPFKRSEIIPYAARFKSAPDQADKADARLIVVDCSDIERTGDLEPQLRGLPVAIIDHHAAVQNPPDTEKIPAYVDANAPSVTVLIYALIKTLGMELTTEEAQLLLFGLCTDTGFFRHIDENGAEIFHDAAELLKAGASPKQTFGAMYGGKTLNSRILMGRVLSRARQFFDGRLIVTYEDYEDIVALGIESRDSDTLYQQLQSISGVEAIAYIRQETPDQCSIGLRSRDKIDVSAIAQSLGGGGHKNAASCTVNGDILRLTEMVIEKFQDSF